MYRVWLFFSVYYEAASDLEHIVSMLMTIIFSLFPILIRRDYAGLYEDSQAKLKSN